MVAELAPAAWWPRAGHDVPHHQGQDGHAPVHGFPLQPLAGRTRQWLDSLCTRFAEQVLRSAPLPRGWPASRWHRHRGDELVLISRSGEHLGPWRRCWGWITASPSCSTREAGMLTGQTRTLKFSRGKGGPHQPALYGREHLWRGALATAIPCGTICPMLAGGDHPRGQSGPALRQCACRPERTCDHGGSSMALNERRPSGLGLYSGTHRLPAVPRSVPGSDSPQIDAVLAIPVWRDTPRHRRYRAIPAASRAGALATRPPLKVIEAESRQSSDATPILYCQLTSDRVNIGLSAIGLALPRQWWYYPAMIPAKPAKRQRIAAISMSRSGNEKAIRRNRPPDSASSSGSD